MMCNNKKAAIINFICVDCCKSSNSVNICNKLLDVKRRMVNPDGGLVNYLDKDSEDEKMNKHNTVATARMQRQASNEYSSIL